MQDNNKTARVADLSHRIARVVVEGFQAGENQRVRSGDEDQTDTNAVLYLSYTTTHHKIRT
jgi:hypothetical protein